MSAELDSGKHLVLVDDEQDDSAVWRSRFATTVRAVVFLVSVVAMFFGALLVAGTLMHALRGPHHHGCDDTRGTCTEPR